MAFAIVAFTHRTAHVVDRARSTQPEYDRSGKVIQGGPVAKAVPPWTPFELDEAEAAQLAERFPPNPMTFPRVEFVVMPEGATDPVEWLKGQAAELGCKDATIGELVRG